MKNSRSISGRADFAKGSPTNPMSRDKGEPKFSDCAAAARWPEVKTKAIAAMVNRLDDLKDVRELAAFCALSKSK